jgi:hypothetical protein
LLIAGLVTPCMTNVDDDHLVPTQPMIDKVGIARDWKHTNPWNIGFTAPYQEI